MKKMVCFLMAMLLTFCLISSGSFTANAFDVNAVFNTPEEMADYINQNLDAFVSQYSGAKAQANSISSVSEEISADIFDPDYCEHSFSIPLLNSNDYVVCMDFNGDNGFMVVSKDEVMRIETSGNLDSLYEYDGEIYYSADDNDFMYYQNGDYLLFKQVNTENIATSTSYNGTKDGVILRIYDYLIDRYGDTSCYEWVQSLFLNELL